MSQNNKIIYDLDIFRCEYLFYFKLVNITPLSIGSGKKPVDKADNPIVKITRFYNGESSEEPYIPGSSLKGVLRSEAERFVRSVYDGDDPAVICNIFLGADKDESEKKREEDAKKNNSSYKPCLICSIFGGQTIASRIKIGNAFLTKYEPKAIDIIRKVSINRLTGASHSRRLYDIEYLAPGQEFDWWVRIENIDLLGNAQEKYDKNVCTIIYYLLQKIINEGIEVGGRRSIGYGRLKVKEWHVKKYELDGINIKESYATDEVKNRLRMIGYEC